MSVIPSDAYAFSVPFQDEYQNGTLTFCNQNDQPVTSGSLLSVPFVWKAVSSTPAPVHYTRAYLTLFQPLQYVDPGDWSGYQLTDQALFSNPKHPVAQATYADQPLLWPDQLLPPHWDGLLELRMYFTQPLMPFYTSKYPSAVIQVTGDTWTLVSGGGGSCNGGTATSIETATLPKSEVDTPHVLSANGKNLVVAASATHSNTGSGKAAGSTSTSTSTPNSNPRPSSGHSAPSTSAKSTDLAAGANRGGGGGGSSGGIIAGSIAAVVVLGGGGAWLLRRRRQGSGGSPVSSA